MMKRRHFNLIKTGRKSKLALAVGLALAMSAMGSVYASGNDDTFKNFANGEKLLQTAANWRTYREFLNSTGLQAIGADKAYALGYSGDGVTLGIVDTGVRTDHEEFEGKVDLVNEIVNDWTDKETWHGSHVAGIMVAKKSIGGFGEKNRNMMGVAFNANLKSIDYGLKKNKRIELTKKYISTLSKDVKIINNSWNPETGGDSFIDFAKNDIKNNDRVYVFSAGNDGNIDVSRKMTGKFANDVNIKSNFINVVNIDDMNNVSITSNIAKGAHENTVCAVGTNVNSVSANSLSDYTDMSGTSMAAPYVSGTLGLVQGANPYLSGKQLVDVVLTTANKNFEHPKFAITLKNHEEDDVKIIDGINLICIDYNDKINDISNDLKEYFSKSSDEYLENLLETNLVDVSKFNSLKNISNLISSINDWESSYYNIVTIENDHIIGENKKAKEIIMKIKELYEIKDVYGIQMQANKLRDLLVDLIADDATTKLLSGIENQSNFYKKYDYTFEEVYGQGVVDTGRAVQGLGAIDVDRLSQEDITTRYSNDKFYMYQVDTKKAEDNFKARNYSIWSNDISEKNVNDIHAGLEKTGSVGLILLGENTYTGPTVAKGGFLHIVRGVGGDVYALGNRGDSVEINGYAKNVYALKDCKVKIKDTVTKNYANVDKDFLVAALPDSNKVDINGGLFAIGKNSITGEGSTINVNLTRSDSVIKGALYQDELGKINLSLANEAKFILQQGTGYYAGNSYKSNDTINNLNMNSFASFDMSQDSVYSTLKIANLTGNDGQFILGTDLANCKGDSIFVTGSDAGEHWISIVDKNGIYADNEDGAKKVLVATTPDNVKFKGLALAQDMGVNQYNFNPNIYYDENIKGWYFDGFDKVDDTGAFNDVVTDSKVLTTNAILNKGISNRGNGIFNFKVLQAEKPAMLIKRKESNNGIFGGIWGSVKFLGDGPIKVDVENTNSYAGMQNKYSRTIAIGYHSDLNYIFEANQNVDIKVTSGSKRVHGIYCAPERDIDYKSADGIYGQSLNGKLNSSVLFNSDLSINVSGNGVNQKYVGIENTGAFTVKGKSNITIEQAYDGNEVSIYNYGGNMRFYGDSIISGGRLVNESKKYYDTINKNVYSYENPKIYFDKNLEFYNNGIENHGELIINGDALLYNATLYNNGKCNVNGNLYVKKDLENPSYLHISNGPNGSMHINGSLISDGSYIDNYGDLRLCGDSVIYNYNCRDGAVLTVDNFRVNNFTCYYGNTTTTINSLLDIGELNAQKIIFKILINQEKPNDGDLKSAKLVVGENKTENAKHIISLLPMQEDFLLTNNTKINPFTIIEDSSEKNGGYKLNFTINPFDAGAYNYTPTLTNEKSKDNVDLWKVTDIKLTGSTPDPTPDPDPNPNPTPDPNPDPNPNPTPDPNPDPNPNPNPDPDPNPDQTPDPNPDPNPNPTPDPNPDPNPNPTPDPDPNPTPDPDPNPNPNPTPDPDPNPNPTPDPNPTPAPVLSNLTYNTRANAINNYYRWRDEYNNLQKRLGDLRMSTEENGLWARTFHGKEESGKYGLNNQYNAFQIGYDKQLLQDDGGKWFVGAAVTSYDGKTNYAKQGKADNNSIGLALYGSYLGEKGHYFDVVARHSRLKSELTSYAAGTGNKITGDYHNWGSSLSMEYGRRISMKHDFYLQPEAELTYGTTSSASYSLSDGSRVKQDGISSLTARAGLTVGKEYKNSNIFASISAVHDFGDDNVFSITDKYGQSYKDSSNLKDSWYELSVGGNVKFNNNTYIYADLEKTFGGDIQTKWRYNFGVRYSF